MFIGWIRQQSFLADLKSFEKEQVIDKNLILNTFSKDESCCFGAYDRGVLNGFICAYEMENTILINGFYYKKETSDTTKKRLITILLNNISTKNKPFIILAKEEEKEIFKTFGFQSFAPFDKVIYGQKQAAVFNFTNTMAKSINQENFIPIIKKIDALTYSEDRVSYIKNTLFKSSSLVLSIKNGYQHSYALNKQVIKISPWSMAEGAYHEAEKLLRGVIYHRGLKKIITCIPSNVAEITSLYANYNFVSIEQLELMYTDVKPSFNLEMIYGF